MSFFTSIELTDGTNIAAVKPASTAAIATDPALVVAISPNNTIPVSQSGNWTDRIVGASGVTLDAVLGATKPANTLQVGGNDGTNAYAMPLTSAGAAVKVAGTGSAGTANAGVVTVQGISSMTPVSIAGAAGAFLDQATASAKRTNSLQIGGNDGTNAYAILVDSGGRQTAKISDGTNTATVKAASTAALASDTAIVVTEPGSTTAGACANTAVTSASGSVLSSNVARREVIIINTDVVTVYIGLGQTPTATAYHVALKPCTVAHDGTGGSFISDIFKGQINAIVASTSGHVAVTELT